MALYVDRNKQIRKAYTAYKSRLGNVPSKSVMSFELFKKNYDKTKALTNPTERGLRKAGMSPEKARRMSS